ncbi:MAG: fused MFS/spermidine synthase [Fibrobacteria bacterium]
MNTILILMLGAIAGAATYIDFRAESGYVLGPIGEMIVSLLIAAAIGMAAIWLVRLMTRKMVKTFAEGQGVWEDYRMRDAWCYLPFLLSLAGAVGVQVSVPVVYFSALAFALAQTLLLFSLISKRPQGGNFFLSLGWVSFLFLVSGMAALIYEIVWQRVLFAEYGINIESVTIIVSLFMFGLGVGSLVGGRFANRFPDRLPHLFVFCELAIGLFGLISLPLIKLVARHTLGLPLLGVTLTIYALLALPTVFMGATLPILVTYLHRYYKHVGRSVSKLYFFNTIGSALASLFTVDLLFVFFGQQAVVLIAVALNFTVAFLVFRYTRRMAMAGTLGAGSEASPSTADEHASTATEPGSTRVLPFAAALLLAGVAGYVSLSQEILWVRAISYATATWPQIFGHILGFFLIGVGLGSLLGNRICEKGKRTPLAYLAGVFLFGSLAYYISIPAFSAVFTLNRGLGILASYVVLAVVAALFGSVLPLLSHFAIRPGSHVGVSLSRIYVANIVGSTAGPLLTGFYLMDRFSLEFNVLIVSLMGLAVAGLLFILDARRLPARMGWAAAICACMALAVAAYPRAFHHVLEKMQYDENYSAEQGFKYINQSRSGIITVAADTEGDIIYGGGGYDGRFNVDPVSDANIIRRVYMVPALHPHPEKVLEIGLSGGSWAWVMSKYPGIKEMEVVEINPGYDTIIGEYPVNKQIFHDPRIVYHYDDGRRWLNRHPDSKFDFILMNTTWHWRSNTTNLLSQEFLRLAKTHLNPGGVIYYNSTHSDDVIYTAATVFKHITTYSTFVAASDSAFAMSDSLKRERLLLFADGAKPIFDTADTASMRVLGEMAHADVGDKQDAFLGRADLQAITDDNMLTEFKKITGKNERDIKGKLYRWYNPKSAWRFAKAESK